METLKDEFVRFLKAHHAYKGFVRGFNNEEDYFSNLERFLEVANPWDYITDALIWVETQEGWDYWNRLDDLWQYFLNKRE